MTITARVRQSTHPHQSTAQAAGRRHLVLDAPLTGRLRRSTGDALCRPVTDFYELLRDDLTDEATCRRCLDLAARYGVRAVIAAEPSAPAPQRDEPSDMWTISDSTGTEIARVHGATADDMTRAAERLPTVRAAIARDGGFTRRRLWRSEVESGQVAPPALPQRAPGGESASRPAALEGIVVEHAGTAQGSTPSHASHPDVAAARAALASVKAAPMTDHHDVTEPAGDERAVRGYLIAPREQGRVALYWLEEGRTVRHDDIPRGASLDCLAWTMERAGWTVEKMLRSSQCVFARRPAAAAVPAAIEPAVVEQPTAPTPFRAGDRVVCGDGNVRTVAGMMHRAGEPARVIVEEGGAAWIASECSLAPACVHRITPRPDVSGDPIKWCDRKHSTQEAGVFGDEDAIETYDCVVRAANRAAELNVEEGADADDPLYGWDLLCVDHRDNGQPRDDCHDCDALDQTQQPA